MNTTIGTAGLPARAEQQVEAWFRYVEGKLSRFRTDSELSQLNRSNGSSFAASALLYEVLAVASYYCRETGGLFNPFLGSVLGELGYNTSFDQLERTGVGQTTAPRPRPTRQAVLVPLAMSPSAASVSLLPGVAIDLGGIAKGWSAQTMRNWLGDDGIDSGVIDAGGDIVAWGEGDRRSLAVADPFDPERDIAVLKLRKQAAAATSSTLKRRWAGANRQVRHHIVDPVTQQPSQSDLVQVTVLADDLTVAEVYAKCLLILGSENGAAWLKNKRHGLGFLGVRSDGSVVTGPTLPGYCLEWSVRQ